MAGGDNPIEAAFDEIDAEEGGSDTGGARRILSALAAIVALAGFGAIVWYAYSTGVREGSEVAAPLLKPDGPSKIAPQDPGGREILDQDKRVYGVIDRSAEGRQVERLLPPPENPLPPPAARKPAAAPPPTPAPAAKPQQATSTPATKPQQATPTPAAKPPLATPKLAVPEPPPPPPAITAPAKVPPPPKSVSKPVSKPAAKPAPKPAAKPAAKPKVAAERPKPAPVTAKKAAPAAKPAPGKGYRVQIASLRSAEAAKRAWAKQVKQSGGVLAGLTLFVKRVVIPKKGTYFRVQAGPLLDKVAAQRVCNSLKRRKIGCFVVKP